MLSRQIQNANAKLTEFIAKRCCREMEPKLLEVKHQKWSFLSATAVVLLQILITHSTAVENLCYALP